MPKKDRSWLCSLCIMPDTEDGPGMPKEFKSFKEYQEHSQKAHPKGVPAKKVEKPVKVPPVKPTVPIQDRPKTQDKLELVYRWLGRCPHCGVEIETIPLDVDGRSKEQYIIAWCPGTCKKKLVQKVVAKL